MFESERQAWLGDVTLWFVGTVGLCFWVPVPALLAQDAPKEKCVVEGVARSALTQMPVSQVSIRLVSWAGKVGYSNTSSSTGAFHFEGVEPGDYSLLADRSGYSNRAVLTNKSRRPISELHLAAGHTESETELWLTPDGGVAGRVLGPDGEPLPGAQVTLIGRQWQRGRRVYHRSSSDITNAAGEYHFAQIAAGRYFVYARRPSSGPLAFSILEAPGKPELRIAGRYHPDAPELDGAEAIEVQPGQQISGIDIRLPLVPVFHVRGRAAASPSPSEATNIVLLAKRTNDRALDWDVESTAAGADGSFDIAGVIPGSYFLYSARRGALSTKLPVTIGAKDASGLLSPPATQFELKGRIRLDDGAPGKDALVFILCVGRQAGDNPFRWQASAPADGTFVIRGLAPDRYTIQIPFPGGEVDTGYRLKSVRVNGEDLQGTEIDMTTGPVRDVELLLSTAVGRVEGTVRWPDEGSDHPAVSEPAAAVIVLVVPEGVPPADHWPRIAQPGEDGHFRVTGLAPGRCRAFALTNYDQGLWQNAEFLGQMAARGVPFEVAEEGVARIELSILPASEVRQVEEGIK